MVCGWHLCAWLGRPKATGDGMGQSRWMPWLTSIMSIIYSHEGVLDLLRLYVGYCRFSFHANKYQLNTYPMDKAALGYELTTLNPGSSMIWALTLIITTLSHACALHEGMLRGVKLGMLWGNLKSIFCHRSSPNRSCSKNKIYPHLKHDEESLKYSYIRSMSGTVGFT